MGRLPVVFHLGFQWAWKMLLAKDKRTWNEATGVPPLPLWNQLAQVVTQKQDVMVLGICQAIDLDTSANLYSSEQRVRASRPVATLWNQQTPKHVGSQAARPQEWCSHTLHTRELLGGRGWCAGGCPGHHCVQGPVTHWECREVGKACPN